MGELPKVDRTDEDGTEEEDEEGAAADDNGTGEEDDAAAEDEDEAGEEEDDDEDEDGKNVGFGSEDGEGSKIDVGLAKVELTSAFSSYRDGGNKTDETKNERDFYVFWGRHVNYKVNFTYRV